MFAPHFFALATRAINRRRFTPRWIAAWVVLCTIVADISPAFAATNGTWIDGTTGGLWSTTANWSGDTVANGSGGIADFSTLNITADDTVHLDSARTIGQLLFGDTTPSNNWILDNNGNALNVLTLAVTSGSPTITVNNDTATMNLVLAGTQGLTKSGGGELVLNDADTFTGGVAINAGTLALGNSSALGSTSNTVSVNAGATLDLSGQSIGANALSIAGTGVGGNGALINSSASPASFAGTVTGTGPFSVGGSGNITLSGTVGGFNTLTKIGNNTLTLSGTTDNAGLGVVVNSGTVILAKASSGSPNPDVHAVGGSGLTVNGGTAQLGGTGGDQLFDQAPVTITSGTFDTNGQSETFATLSLQGSGIGSTGALVNSAAASSTITPTSGTTLTGNTTIGVTQGTGNLVLNNSIGGNFALTKLGAGTLTLTAAETYIGITTVSAGTLQLGDGATHNGLVAGDIADNGALIFANPNFQSYAGAISGTGAVTKSGAGTLTLSGANSYGGATAVSQGTLQGGAVDTIPQGSAVNVANGATFNLGGFAQSIGSLTGAGNVTTTGSTGSDTLTVGNDNTSPTAFSGAISNASGGRVLALAKTGAGTLTLTGLETYTGVTTVSAGTLQLGDGTTNVALLASSFITDNGTLAFALPPNNQTNYGISVGGSGGVLVSGAGTLTLSGNNTFTGGVTINAVSTLLVGNAGALNSTVPNVTTINGTLTLNGNSVTVANLTGSGTVQNASPTAASLTVNVSGALNESFSGTIQDGTGAPLSLVKTGTGTLTIGGGFLGEQIITYTGTTTISGGTLRVKTAGFDPDPSNNVGTAFTSTTIVDNGVLQFNIDFVPPQLANDLAAYLGNISGSGSLTKSGGGTLLLAGNNTYTGTTTITGGTLELLIGSLSSDVVNQATFEFDGGTFSGRLTNLGTAKFDADFIPGNGMENDGIVTVAAGVNVTFNGAGLDNEGTLTATGGTINLSGAANVNRGNLTVSSIGLAGATLANNGSLTLAGGTINGTSGSLINGIGGSISGTGVISTGFTNSGGIVIVGSGTLNITQPFTNGGIIQLTSFTANLVGGAITNAGTINGFGDVANAVTNFAGGTIEPVGGNLYLAGALQNQVGALIRVGSGNKLVVTAGLTANAGTISLVGGTFDNDGHPLNDTGQISGFGIFATGGTGLDNNGTITFSGGLTTVNGPVTNEGGRTITVTQNPAIFTGLVTNNMNATFNTVNATATFAGGFVNNGNSNFVKAGGGTVEIDTAPTLNDGSTLSVTTGTMRFNVVSGMPTIGTGVTATVSSGATLELAGSVAALANGSNRVNIVNNSNAPGIVVSGTDQQVGNIDGPGTTQVNAGSNLTANHIIQGALLIGGTAKNPGLVTVDASDASGTSLASLAPAANPLAPEAPTGAGINVGSLVGDPLNGDPTAASSIALNSSASAGLAAVPEPSSLILLAIGGLAIGGAAVRRTGRAP